jgi:hypothetical protein
MGPVLCAAGSAPAADEKPANQTTPPTAPSTQPAATTQPVAEVSFDKLKFSLPDGWVKEQPKSGMRKAQLRLPGEGEGSDAELVVFYFGPGAGEGGSVQANFDRWIGQFRQDDGRDSKDVAVKGEKKSGELTVHTLDIVGRYVAPLMPGAPAQHDLANARMLAAVIPTPEGNYFLKLVGPAVTINSHLKKYGDFLTSLTRTP